MIVESLLYPVTTKRKVIAQISLCKGCCCGNIDRGKPPVPVDQLKQVWKSRGLSKVIQLSVSGCLGPCDVINVVRISGLGEDVWLGNFTSLEDYLELAEWASESKTAKKLSALLPQMEKKRFDPFTRLASEQVKDTP